MSRVDRLLRRVSDSNLRPLAPQVSGDINLLTPGRDEKSRGGTGQIHIRTGDAERGGGGHMFLEAGRG